MAHSLGGVLAARIALIGLSGAGKTTVAPLLAVRLGLDWIDLDEAVEQKAGKTISALISAEGEEAFRGFETLALRAALGGGSLNSGYVIACGGGVLEHHENRSLLSEHTFVVWLRVVPETAAQRIEKAGLAARPLLLQGWPAVTGLQNFWVARRGLYERAADAAVDTDGRTPGEVAAAIEILSAGRRTWGSSGS